MKNLFYNQIYNYFNKIFSKYLCWLRKGYNTQHCLLFMLESLKNALDKGLCTGILLTDLSKAFDCITHDLLIAKLHAYGFTKISLKLISNYLCDRTQRTKICDKFSSWCKIIYGVPQGSIFGPLVFNICVNDLFLFSQNFSVANYDDDCSPYEFIGSIDEIILKLQHDSLRLNEWYQSNYLKPNPDIWHLFLSDKDDNYSIDIGNDLISNSTDEIILGIYCDNKLNFNTHLMELCKKSSQKLHALARVSNLMSIKQRKIIMNAFIHSQCSYCPLVWMCHSRTVRSLINNIHEISLRIVYNDNISSITQLLEKSGSVSIHHRNLQALTIEVYKSLNNLSSPLMSDLIKLKETTYNLRNTCILINKRPIMV